MREKRGEQLGSCLERDYWNWLSCSGSGSQPTDGMIVISALDLSSFVTVHVTSGPSLVHSPLPSLVTLASHWSRARWQQSWQICPALIGWPPLNHGQFLKLWRVKMPASVDNIFRALLLTDVYFIFFMSYGWVVPWRRWLGAGCLNTLTAERRRGGETKTVSINCVNYKASDTKHLWKMQTVSELIMAQPRRYLNRSHLASQLEQAARVC